MKYITEKQASELFYTMNHHPMNGICRGPNNTTYIKTGNTFIPLHRTYSESGAQSALEGYTILSKNDIVQGIIDDL